MQLSMDPAGSGPCGAAAGPGTPTWLVTPGIVPTRFATAVASGAAVVLLDLEDSVPAKAKANARTEVLAFAARRSADGAGPLLGVRINAADSTEGLRDIAAMSEWDLWPDLIVVPKVESSGDIEAVTRTVRGAHPATKIWALIESPRAIVGLSDIVHAPGLAGVLFGAADYAAAAGSRITSRAMWYPRCQIITAAAAAGIPAIDSPFFSLDAPDALRTEAVEAVELGFAGKVAVHPHQLPVIEEAFAPSPSELEAARAVLAAADRAGGGITMVDGAMVGPPLVAAARAVVRRGDRSTTATTTSLVKAS
ncbi:HpcH/HpaI aldolase/citrate lyase family protein [Kitasatospora sp. NPDC088160]|uniref:HpcH/HpaI aldolase/citrate lyase family protein n=1 Tax=Kitasatospora sp. NPDC088160 TaxID=3364072 RepID=UPI00380CCC88